MKKSYKNKQEECCKVQRVRVSKFIYKKKKKLILCGNIKQKYSSIVMDRAEQETSFMFCTFLKLF